MNHVIVERELGGRKLKIETGKWAKQAAGSAVVTLGDTIVLAAVAEQPMKAGMDFFPLTVDYREKGFSAGKIFGGRFSKREGRPTDKETLTMRLIDRPIRPLFPEGYIRDVLIQNLVVSAEPDVDPDVVAMIATSVALSISPLPFQGPIAAVRVGYVDGQYVVNPGVEALKNSKLQLVLAGTKDAVTMVESEASELPDETMLGAIEFGHAQIKNIIGAIDELVSKVQVTKYEVETVEKPAVYAQVWKENLEAFRAAATAPGKDGRHEARKNLRDIMVEKYAAKEGEEASGKPSVADVKGACDYAWEKIVRRLIREGKRCDGRSRTDIRPIWCEAGLLPRSHGSALFTRGETQALVAATLGTASDEQTIETLRGEVQDRFMLHYNFPSFSVGEVKMPRGPGRREIGHGFLAQRGLKAMLPDYADFPYTIRIVSEILESNGSSSMASVCGGTMALFDAGVPMKAAVAGIAMGLVEDEGEFFVISDILGDEDHYGDMDFKVAGTRNGVTALQMDIKSMGISIDLMRKALLQAKDGRFHILDQMAKVIAAPRENISQYAPKIVKIKIDVEKIGKLIGPGGKMIRALEEKHKVKIEVSDDGNVIVASEKRDQADACRMDIEGLTGTPEVGKVYMGEVVNIKDFGVFFEIMPGVDGLCHVSELHTDYVKNAADIVKVGDKMEIKLIAVDDLGRLKLSRKHVMIEKAGGVPPPVEPSKPREPRGDRGGKPIDRERGRK